MCHILNKAMARTPAQSSDACIVCKGSLTLTFSVPPRHLSKPPPSQKAQFVHTCTYLQGFVFAYGLYYGLYYVTRLYYGFTTLCPAFTVKFRRETTQSAPRCALKSLKHTNADRVCRDPHRALNIISDAPRVLKQPQMNVSWLPLLKLSQGLFFSHS